MILPPPPGARKVRKQLSADALYALLREGFSEIPDHRQPEPPIPLRDALMSAFAMFSLKDPSLLAFDQRRSDGNLEVLFGIGQIPSDTQMREILDPLEPERLRPLFGDVFRALQRGKALEPFEFHNGCYLLALDGTGYFSSQQIHCPSCQVKEHKNGTVTYEHQMLAAVLVHPDIVDGGLGDWGLGIGDWGLGRTKRTILCPIPKNQSLTPSRAMRPDGCWRRSAGSIPG